METNRKIELNWKTVGTAVMVMFTVMGSIIGIAAYMHQVAMGNLQNQQSAETSELETEINALETEASELQAKIEDLQTELDDALDRVGDLESENDDLRFELANFPITNDYNENEESEYDDADIAVDADPQQEDNMHSYDLIANLDFFTVDPPANENGWIEDGELRFWDTGRQQDNEGNLHASGGIFAGNSGHILNEIARNWSVAHEHSVTYLLNADYSRFTGIIALSWDSRDTQDNYEIRFWNVDDSSIIYTSPVITGGTRPISFDIDVTGIEQLRIERLSPSEEWNHGLAEIGILDARFHR